MERFTDYCYNMGHETPWIARGTGKAPPARHRIAERRQGNSLSRCAFGGGIKKLRIPMVPRVPDGRVQGPSSKNDSGPSAEAVSDRKGQTFGTPFVGSLGSRVSDRPLDLKAYCHNHPEALWGTVSPESCVALASGDGMELSETRASGLTKERERNRPLENLPLAAYKKTPKDVGPIWCSSMSRAFCSFRTSVVLGLQEGRPQSSITSINRTGFPRLMHCRFRQKGSALPFISGSGGAILTAWTFVLSSKLCSNIFGVPSSCCGIEGRSIAAKRSPSSSEKIQEFIWNIFRLMRLSLIPQNMFGTRPTEPFPMQCRRAWVTSKRCCETRYAGYGDHQGSFGLVSLHLIFHGPDKSFHYLYESQ